MHTFKIALVAFVLLLSPVLQAANPPAATANTEGYRYYKKKNYPKAIESFQKSIALDSTYSLPQFNLACTLALLREKGKVCEYDAYKRIITDHLAKAIALNPARKWRMLNDPDLKSVRGTVAYQKLMGRSFENPKDLSKILQAITWYDSGLGVYGSMLQLQFKSKGKLVRKEAVVPEDFPAKPITWKVIHGSYQIQGQDILINFNEDIGMKGQNVKRLRASLSPEKEQLELFLVENTPATPVETLYDHSSECEL